MNRNMFTYCSSNPSHHTHIHPNHCPDEYDNYEIHITNEPGPPGPPGILGPIDKDLVPDISNNYNLGSLTYPFQFLHCNEIIMNDSESSNPLTNNEITYSDGKLRLPVGTLIGGVNPGTLVLKGTVENTTLLPTSTDVSLGDTFLIGDSLHICTATYPDDVSYNSIQNIRGPEGPRGPKGNRGSVGPIGPTGPAIFSLQTEVIEDVSFTYIEYDGKVKVRDLDISGVTSFSALPIGQLTRNELSYGSIQKLNDSESEELGDGWPSNEQKFMNSTEINFSTIGIENERSRSIRCRITFPVDLSGNSTDILYVALYDGSTVLDKYRKTIVGSDVVSFEHLGNVSAGTSKTYTIFMASEHGMLSLTNYSKSYVYIEDLGLI